MTAQEVCKQLQIKYKTQYEIFMQNGKDAGQTVNHVHLHLMPKYQNIEALEKKNSEIRT
jgi:diadenosine tetraphosphate (Ap4A) HIT family hydrolase